MSNPEKESKKKRKAKKGKSGEKKKKKTCSVVQTVSQGEGLDLNSKGVSELVS